MVACRDTFLDRLRLAQQALADRLLLRLSRLLQASHGRGAVALDGGVQLRQRRPEVAPDGLLELLLGLLAKAGAGGPLLCLAGLLQARRRDGRVALDRCIQLGQRLLDVAPDAPLKLLLSLFAKVLPGGGQLRRRCLLQPGDVLAEAGPRLLRRLRAGLPQLRHRRGARPPGGRPQLGQ